MKKVLITGYMRSGTTFLANFLNSQEKCLIYRDFLVTIFRTSKNLRINSFLTPLDEQQKNVLLFKLKAEARTMGSNVMDELGKEFTNLKELYDAALDAMGKKNGYEVIGSKVTVVDEWMPKIINETDVNVIYIFRDPRDVLLSVKNAFPNYYLPRYMLELENDINVALGIKSESFLRVKFEDLILNTEPTIGKLSDFLGVELTRNVSSGKDRGIDWLDNSAFHDLNKMFDKKACYRWKKKKDSKEVKYCEILRSDLLKELGYGSTGNTYTISDKLTAYKEGSIASVIYNRNVKNLLKQILFRFM